MASNGRQNAKKRRRKMIINEIARILKRATWIKKIESMDEFIELKDILDDDTRIYILYSALELFYDDILSDEYFLELTYFDRKERKAFKEFFDILSEISDDFKAEVE